MYDRGVTAVSSAINATGASPIVIAPCSASKRQKAGTAAAARLPYGDQRAVEAAWLRLLAEPGELFPSESLYRGRAFGYAKTAAASMGADFGVVSAGLGYVAPGTTVPTYDLTVRTGGPGSVTGLVSGEFSPTEWWAAVCKGPFSSDLVSDCLRRPLVLFCLTRDYARMIAESLESLAPIVDRVRILGLSVEKHVPSSIARAVLPYDERLDAIGTKGTRLDFAGRALLHYASAIRQDSDFSLDTDVAAVKAAMRSLTKPGRPRQRRMADQDILALIADFSSKSGDQLDAILRHIRHVEGRSCSQERLTRLRDEYRRQEGA